MQTGFPIVCVTACLWMSVSAAVSEEAERPHGIESEQSLPSRYPYVVQDMLKFCKPNKGFWVDVGAGNGGVALALVEATGQPVVMLDPNQEALTEAMESGRKSGLQDRLLAVVGKAEALPFPDGSVDLIVSRGSIFFWQDPAAGLREIYRVLRPGGMAYIGGGAGSGYPLSSAKELVQGRQGGLKGDDAEKWKRFVELRRPERMTQWAQEAGLADFEVMGRGALSAEDSRVGQGVWLLFGKKPALSKKNEGQ